MQTWETLSKHKASVVLFHRVLFESLVGKVGSSSFLTYAAVCPCMPAGKCEGCWGKGETGRHGDPFTFSSVHHWNQGLPLSSGSVVQLSSSPLLLLPLVFLCSLSANSIAIQELRCDPNALSSVITTISREDGFCHLNCLLWAHVTSNSPCVAFIILGIIWTPVGAIHDDTTEAISSSVCHFFYTYNTGWWTRRGLRAGSAAARCARSIAALEIRMRTTAVPAGYANSEQHAHLLHTEKMHQHEHPSGIYRRNPEYVQQRLNPFWFVHIFFLGARVI